MLNVSTQILFANYTNFTRNVGRKAEYQNIWEKAFQKIVISIAIPLSVIGIIGNVIIIYKLGFAKAKIRNQYETFLLVLGLADLICMAVTPNVMVYGTLTHFQSWHAGLIGCKIILSVLPMNVTVSQGLLILISYHRYEAVKKPLSSLVFTGKRVFIWSVICVLISLLLVFPYAYALELVDEPKHATKTCTIRGAMSKYTLAFTAINVSRDTVTTIVLIAIGNSTTRVLKKTNQGFAAKNSNQRWKNARIASTMRVKKLLKTVVIVFCLCTFPLDVYQLLLYVSFQLFGNIPVGHYTVLRNINTALLLLQASNSAANIFIYAKVHKDFKFQAINLREKLSFWIAHATPYSSRGTSEETVELPLVKLTP